HAARRWRDDDFQLAAAGTDHERGILRHEIETRPPRYAAVHPRLPSEPIAISQDLSPKRHDRPGRWFYRVKVSPHSRTLKTACSDPGPFRGRDRRRPQGRHP